MIALLQRVTHAEVAVEGNVKGRIGRGILVFAAVERGDREAQMTRMAERIIGYRIFADGEQRMNLSVADIGGGLLLVSQFTLAADTRKGARPSFTPAAEPGESRRLFEYFVEAVRHSHAPVSTGEFGADMQVSLVNDGPVSFTLRAAPDKDRSKG
jgi:D-aminoacyl-tRNA deacylase